MTINEQKLQALAGKMIGEIGAAANGVLLLMGGGFESLAAVFANEGRLTRAFQTGERIGWDQHCTCLFCGTERFFRTGYKTHLVDEWLPALDGVVGLHQDRVPADPGAFCVNQSRGARNISPGSELAVQVANRNNPMRWGCGCRCGYGQSQHRHKRTKARRKSPQERLLLRPNPGQLAQLRVDVQAFAQRDATDQPPRLPRPLAKNGVL
jgi:hypothetical protein